jgi:hypothetical protein|tara:strand:- start:12 stop:197 length:186 start_codon:yes stop_codon:yes gene_type:complete
MGISPTDKSEDFIKSGMTLITEVASDKYLNKVKTNKPPSNRLSRPCGGKGGFDDYVERWHQ